MKRDRSGRLRRSALMRDAYICQTCKQPFPEGNLEADHIIPLHEGGWDIISNIQILCIPCHSMKTKAEKSDGSHQS